MQIASIQGETRKPGGRHANARLRKRGLVPAVIYGHGLPPETVALSRHDLLLALEHAQHVIRLAIDGQETQFLLKDVQYDHLQHLPIHADLMRVDVDERVHVNVGIEFRGEPHGVHEGGELIQVLTDLDIECPLVNIPEVLRLKIDHLGVGEALHVRDIQLPAGVSTRHNLDDVIATVRAKRGVTIEEEEAELAIEEGGEEPEVIGRAAKQEESEGEG
ncbi:MAG: 50S ribosomal protein L25 [Phycisphaerae bacterium]